MLLIQGFKGISSNGMGYAIRFLKLESVAQLRKRHQLARPPAGPVRPKPEVRVTP